MGRPTLDASIPMDTKIQIRMDKGTLKKLDRLAEKEKMNRSEYIRQLIKKVK
nr:MAG TPA: NikA, BACTERIAL CONJUGATION, RELAXASE, DNA [Caudoviricetes sp.]